MARRGITNYLQIRVKDMDLSECTNIKLMIRQARNVYTYSGTVDSSDSELLNVTIPKSDAVKLRKGPAEFQVALTDADGIPRSHDPIVADIGELLEVTGYGS